MVFEDHKLPGDLDHTKFPAGSPEAIWVEACSKAEAALVQERLRCDNREPTYCGGAYILIRPARGKFVAFLKKHGLGENGDYGGWTVSVPSSYHGQSRDWHEAKARAFKECLKAHGIKAFVKSYAT